jgi:non-specific serine/threonine protein kinase
MSGDHTQGMTTSTAGAHPASHAALPKGTHLQEFEVVEVIGEGGFGIVYLADDLQLHRAVAVKEYMPASLASRGAGESVVCRSEQNLNTFQAGMRSFIAEARMLAQFKHPALIEVFRFWEQNGTAYMAMPYYKGRTLRQVLQDESHMVDERWLKVLFAPLMDALDLMHAQNVYHRDVAPDNVLILGNGAPVLLDLGAARRIIGDLTQAVTVVLKPGYAPIEQYADDGSSTQGPWTDIYAIGAVLYFAIAGRAPVASVSRIMKDTLKPLDVATYPDYSAEFLAGISHALAVKPEDRPQSIAELRDILGISSYAATTMQPPVTASAATLARERAAANAATEARIQAAATQQTSAGVSANQIVAAEKPAVPVASASSAPDAHVAIDSLFASAESAEAPAQAKSPTTQPPTQPKVSPGSARPAPLDGGKKSVMPLAVGALLLLAALGGGAFMFMDSSSTPEVQTADRSAAVAAGTVAPLSEPQTAPVVPPSTDTVAQGGQPAPVEAAITPPVSAVVPDRLPVETISPKPPEREHKGVQSERADKDGQGVIPEKATVGEGRVRFSLHPWGEVWVDGTKRGVSPPLSSLKLSAGSHRIELRNPGLPSVVQNIQVKKGAVLLIEHHFTSEAGFGGL